MKDEIIEEVRRIRAEILEECGNDMEVYFERLKQVRATIPESLQVTPEEWRQRHPRADGKNAVTL